MPNYRITATLNGSTQKFRLTAASIKAALQRLFTAKPALDVATNLTVAIFEDTEEDIS